jgi:hypothetical protein
MHGQRNTKKKTAQNFLGIYIQRKMYEFLQILEAVKKAEEKNL